METIIASIKAAGRQLPGATVSYRDDWACDYFSVAGKSFCLLGETKTGELVMTVKGLPEINEELREQYSFVIPGYYTNKVHWNSILLKEATFTLAELNAHLQASYELVVAKLPKKVRESL